MSRNDPLRPAARSSQTRVPFTHSDRLHAHYPKPEDRRLSMAIVVGAGVAVLSVLVWLASSV